MMQDNPQDSLSAALKPNAPARAFPALPAPLVISALALLITAGFGFYLFQSAQTLKSEIRNDLATSNKTHQELQILQQSAVRNQQQLEARLALIEAHQAETRAQQDVLTGMYDALTRSDTVRALGEIEQTLTFASQQLQLTGNVAAAQAMLVNVDLKLSQLGRPELINLRQALARDIDTIKAQPTLDLSGMIVKLDNLAASLDKLPLSIDGYQVPVPAAPKVEGDRLKRFAAEVWHEIKQLIQIRRMDRADALLLSPEQAFFVRENIKLRLMDARTALLLRDEATFRADIKAVLGYMKQHFDARSPVTTGAVNLLQQYASQSLPLKLPDLGGSLAAARNARAVAERVKP